MRKLMLSTSTFYLHADQLGEEVESLSRAGVDSFHVDLMDRNLVCEVVRIILQLRKWQRL